MAKSKQFKNTTAFNRPDSYVAYDYETSDLFNAGGEILEIGAVKVLNRMVVDEFQELCAFEGTIHPKAFEKHRITKEELVGKRTLSAVFSDFVNFVGQLPLVGFNNHAFDDLFTQRECERLGIPDMLSNGSDDARVLHGGGSLEFCCRKYGLANEDAHRALSDAKATQELYEVLRIEALCESTDVRDITAEVVGDELAGELVCFTNDSDYFPKRACQTLALAHSAKLSNRVTKKVTLLVNLTDYISGNVTKAQQYGIKVITGKEFLELIGEPSDQPVKVDVLHTGRWMSTLGEETRLMVRRELGLPIQKGILEYFRPGGFVEENTENPHGVTVPVVRQVLSSVNVVDWRVIDACDDCGLATLEIKLEGVEGTRLILSPHFESMQHGEEYYRRLSVLEESDDDEQ